MMRRRGSFQWAAVIVTVAVASMSVSACRGVLGIDDRTVEERPGPEICAGASAFETSCASCLDDSCCDALAACRADEPCTRVLDCFAACRGEVASVTACRIRCGQKLQTSFDLVTSRFMSCQSRSCGPACSLKCGGYVHPNALCEACVARSCCAETSACAADAQCLALSTCLATCAPRDGPCMLDCNGQLAGGRELRTAVAACIDGACAGSCYDSAWACLGKATATEDPAPIALAITALDLVTARGLPDVSVRVCLDSDPTCAGDGTPDLITDANGVAKLALMSLRDRCIRLTGASIRTTCFTPSFFSTASGEAGVPVIRNVGYARLFSAPLPSDANGSVLLLTHDCAAKPSSGVSFSTPANARTLYWRRERFEAGVTATDSAGLGAMLDVPAPAMHLVRADLGLGLPVVAQRTVFVRAGVISILDLGP
jgi:hypothetical protein